MRVLGIALALGLGAHSACAFTATGGVLSIVFKRPLMGDMGLTVTHETTTALPLRDGAVAFAANGAEGLFFKAANGDFEVFSEGALQVAGGFILHTAAADYGFSNFRVDAIAQTDQLLFDADDGDPLFRLDHVHAKFLPESSQLFLQNMDVTITDRFAERLGRPEFAGLSVGVAEMRLGVAP